MKKTITCIASILIYAMAASLDPAQAQEQSKSARTNNRGETTERQFRLTDFLAQARPPGRTGFALIPASSNAAGAAMSAPSFVITPMSAVANLQVFGSGTLGRLTKWTGFSSSNSVIGDSNIYEDKFGKVGIGTTAPTSLFTVQGVIETFGGIKFGDGTTQTTSTAGALFGVAHDATLQGSGTAASLLGVAVPLNLSGSSGDAVLSAINNGNGNGVSGTSTNSYGVFGQTTSGSDGVKGFSHLGNGVGGESFQGIGVRGVSFEGSGVSGESFEGTGVSGESTSSTGVSGVGSTGVIGTGSSSGTGVFGEGGNSAGAGDGGLGVFAEGGSGRGVGNSGGTGMIAKGGPGTLGATPGIAGRFLGDVDVLGKLTKSMGTFKIDHPLDPENKYLYHSFVESPDMMNIYNGNITTDGNGDAVVEMPDYFDALNKDFRYQLTVIGTFAQAIIASKMKGNRFSIKTNAPEVEVSWMVTGVRQDAYAEKHRVKVEEVKTEKERGYYLHPEVFNQPEEKSIEWARHPEMMQKLKQQRLEAEAKIKKEQ